MQHPDPVPGAPDPIEDQVLIHIAEDPREDHNLLSTQAEVAAGLRSRLCDWFREIQAEPHAFHSPTFAIGTGTTNTVFLAAPQRLHGGLRNGVQAIEGWMAPGDRAEYRVDARTTGGYRVTLEAHQPLPPDFSLRLDIAGQRTSIHSTIDVDLTVGVHVLTLEATHSLPDPVALRLLRFEVLEGVVTENVSGPA